MLAMCRLWYSISSLYYDSEVAGAGIQHAMCGGLAEHWLVSLAISGWEMCSTFVWSTGHFGGFQSACCRPRMGRTHLLPRWLARQYLNVVSRFRYTIKLGHNREKRNMFGARVDVLGKAHRFAMHAVL